MTKKELIALLVEARNILHKHELGEEVTCYDITNAQDKIDIAVSDMIDQTIIF